MNHYDKRDFPLLAASPIAYLDNAATAQRPECVIQAEDTFYRQYNANPLRGLYPLSVAATRVCDEAREAVRGQQRRDHIHPQHHREPESGRLQLRPEYAQGRRRNRRLDHGASQ